MFSPQGLTKEDYVIVLGDFGLLWSGYQDSEEKYLTKWYNEKPWTTIFLGGNHENYDRLEALEEVPMFGDVVGKVSDSIFFLKTGHIYTIQKRTFLVIGGAQSVDRGRRTPGISWWPQELISFEQQEEIFSVIEKRSDFDFVLTHTCPTEIFEKMRERYKSSDPTMKILQEVLERITFKEWFFGHFHFDGRIDDKFSCLFNTVIEI